MMLGVGRTKGLQHQKQEELQRHFKWHRDNNVMRMHNQNGVQLLKMQEEFMNETLWVDMTAGPRTRSRSRGRIRSKSQSRSRLPRSSGPTSGRTGTRSFYVSI